MSGGDRDGRRARVLARVAVLVFLVVWLGPGLLPGKRLTVACYLSFAAAYRSLPPPPLPVPVIPDQSCTMIDYPNLLLAHRELMDGTAPVILPAGGGVPFLANPQAAPGSLWHMPAILTGSLAAHSWAWALRAALAAALGWLLARRLGLGPAGRALVAAGTASAGMMASQFLMTNPSPVVLLPLLLLMAEECAGRRDRASAILFGGVAGLAPLWGHPEPAFLTVLGAGCWWAAREMTGREWSARFLGSMGGRALLAALVCALVAAPALLPFLAFLPGGVSYKMEVTPSIYQLLGGLLVILLGPALLATLRRAETRQRCREALRRPGGWAMAAAAVAGLVAVALYLDPYRLTNPGAFPRGHALDIGDRLTDPWFLMHFYPGLALLPFVPAGWRRLREWRSPLATMVVLGLGLGWVLPPFDLLRLVPPLWTLTPSYASPLLVLPVLILGAAGLEAMRERHGMTVVLVILGAGAACLWQVWRTWGTPTPAFARNWLEPRMMIAAGLGVAFLAGVALLPRRALALATGVVLVDLFLHACPYARPMPAYDFPVTPAISALERAIGEGGRFVAVTPDPDRPAPNIFPPNAGAAYGLEDVRLTGAMRPRALMERWEEVRLPDMHPNVLLAGSADAALWDDMGVTAVLTKPGAPAPSDGRLTYEDDWVQVWQRPPPIETSAPVASAWGRGDRAAGIAGPLFFAAGFLLFVGALVREGRIRDRGRPATGRVPRS